MKKDRIVFKALYVILLFLIFAFLTGHCCAVSSLDTELNFFDAVIAHIKQQPTILRYDDDFIISLCAVFFCLLLLPIVPKGTAPKAEMKGKEHGSNHFQSPTEHQSYLDKNTSPIYQLKKTDDMSVVDTKNIIKNKAVFPLNVDGQTGRESNLLLSQNIKISYNTWLTKLGSQNTLIVGATGEGKSRGFVKPNVYSLPVDPRDGRPVSFVFTDPKGELCRDTAGFLKENGYDIKVFNLNELRFSDCYNPFRYIHSIESIQIMVDSVINSAQGGNTQKDPHWTDCAKSLLNSICYLVFYEFDYRDQNFSTVSELANMCIGQSEEDSSSDYDLLIQSIEESSTMGSEHPAVVWRKKVAATGREMSSVVSTLQTSLRAFASREVQRLVSTDTLSMDEVGDRPTALYLIISTTNDTYYFLINLLYTQLFESLYYRAQQKYGGSLPHHVTFFLDEFANIGKITGFDKKIATFRSVNLSACIVVQSPNQLATVYENASTDILDNIHQTVFLGSAGLDEKSAPGWISKALGYKTIQAEQTSVKASKYSDILGNPIMGDIDHSYSATQRALLTPEEIRQLPPDACIVIIKGQYPFLDKKIDLNTCLNYSSNRFTCKNSHGRTLKPDFLFPINDSDPNYPSCKKTSESFKCGVHLAKKVTAEQQKMRKDELRENEKYDPVPNGTVTPIIKPAQELLSEQFIYDNIVKKEHGMLADERSNTHVINETKPALTDDSSNGSDSLSPLFSRKADYDSLFNDNDD